MSSLGLTVEEHFIAQGFLGCLTTDLGFQHETSPTLTTLEFDRFIKSTIYY